MDKVIGGILAIVAFLAVLVAGLMREMGLFDTVWRGVVAATLGYFVGWLLFGKIGMQLAREAAGEPELPAPEKPKEPTSPASK